MPESRIDLSIPLNREVDTAFLFAYAMTAAELSERASAYATILAEWEQQRDAHYREADQLNHDIEELRTYQANIAALASIEEGRRRYNSRRRVG